MTGRRWILIGVVVGAVFTSCVGAFAYFKSSGSGSGSASTGTMSLTVNTVTISPSLAPGLSSDIVLNVSNPNGYAVTVTSITAGTITASATCTTPAVTFTPGTLPTSIAAGTSTITLTGAATMGSNASNDCQGATFTIPVSIAVKH